MVRESQLSSGRSKQYKLFCVKQPTTFRRKVEILSTGGYDVTVLEFFRQETEGQENPQLQETLNHLLKYKQILKVYDMFIRMHPPTQPDTGVFPSDPSERTITWNIIEFFLQKDGKAWIVQRIETFQAPPQNSKSR